VEEISVRLGWTTGLELTTDIHGQAHTLLGNYRAIRGVYISVTQVQYEERHDGSGGMTTETMDDSSRTYHYISELCMNAQGGIRYYFAESHARKHAG